MEAPKKKKKQMSANDKKVKLNTKAMHTLLCGLNEEVFKKLHGNKKEEKKDGVSSCANILSSSKVDGVLALNEPGVSSNSCDSNSYSFDELQDAFVELYLEFETMKF
ncbi:hypothetical protein GQ457_05G021200 [Hibiscus cannabinus]